MSVACRPHLQAQLGREARADWVEVLVRETMARKVTAVATTDNAQCIAIFDRHAVELYLAMR
jgi:hypothetical protein